VTEPEPAPVPVLAGTDLYRAIIAASRAYIAAQQATSSDPQTVADTKAALDGLIAQRDGTGG
jgi:hypothetical protein